MKHVVYTSRFVHTFKPSPNFRLSLACKWEVVFEKCIFQIHQIHQSNKDTNTKMGYLNTNINTWLQPCCKMMWKYRWWIYSDSQTFCHIMMTHFCSEWCIVGYGTDALWDLWISSVTSSQVVRQWSTTTITTTLLINHLNQWWHL